MAKKSKTQEPESQKWFVVKSKPMISFLEEKQLFGNRSKDSRTKEYPVSNARVINITKGGQIYLVENTGGVIIDGLPEDTKVGVPKTLYSGGVISEKRLLSFIAGQ